MNRQTYMIVTAVLFAVITIIHIVRVILGWPVEIDGLSIPYWVSELAILVTGYLAYIGFRLR